MKSILIKLTLQDRDALDTILKTEKSSDFDRIKAHTLLLSDSGPHGSKISSEKIAKKLSVSLRSITRIKSAYIQNSSIKDVFAFSGLSNNQKKSTHSSSKKLKTSPNEKKKNARYIELDNDSNEAFLVTGYKCRVILSQCERKKLEDIIKIGKHTTRKYNRAKILLLADEGTFGPALNDVKIAEKLEVSLSTIARVRKLLVIQGEIEKTLNFDHKNAGRPSKIDGAVEATLVAQVCGTPPEGRAKWTLRLLADRLVELNVVESISHTAVGEALKKMNLNLGKEKNG